MGKVFCLAIGINNYPGTANDLRGCINDAKDWAALFAKLCDVAPTLLLDRNATKKNMVKALKATVGRLTTGDTAVITYSGHGSWVPDNNGDEPDGRDECFCPYDVSKNVLLDDELATILTTRAAGSNVLLLTDSCHSGTVFRMLGRRTQIRPKFLPPEKFLKGRTRSRAQAAALYGRRDIAHNKPLAGVVHISGCGDTEYSYDAQFGKKPNGAFTATAIKAYKKLPRGATYSQWHEAIHAVLPSFDFPQSPQINAATPLRNAVVLGK